MGVLSDVDLKRILDDNDGIIIIRKREKSITGPGYDLTIGFIRDADTGEEPAIFVDEDNVRRYTLRSGHRYIVISREFLYLSSQYMATIHSRGSYALKGIIVTSTTVDPNYTGCITASLYNYSPSDVHIKQDNQFATMVFYRLCTPTNFFLPINERGNPMDTQETFHSRFPNIHSDACAAGDAYYGQVRKTVEPEYLDAIKRMFQKVKENVDADKEEELGKEEPVSAKTEQESRKIVKITFLIGNGFDLNVGLNTRYSDFYPYYVKRCPDDLLAKEIDENTDRWSDLELALGQVTDKIAPQKMEVFLDSVTNLENEFAKYLSEEMRRIHLDVKEIRDKTEGEIFRSLTGFYMKNQGESIESIKNILEDANNLKEYSFITFNYTDVLEQCLNTFGKRFSPPLLNIASFKERKVLYVHGSIQERNMVLGVNDESQIANVNFRRGGSRRRLVKSYINDSCGDGRDEEAHAIIDSSDIICIFGMSLGKMDQQWWLSIAKWLQQNSSHELVIFVKEESDYFVNIQILMREQTKFFENGNIPENMRDQIVKQIHIVINADLFNIRLVELE